MCTNNLSRCLLGIKWEIIPANPNQSYVLQCRIELMKKEILKQSWSGKGILHTSENSCFVEFEGRDAKQRQKLTE